MLSESETESKQKIRRNKVRFHCLFAFKWIPNTKTLNIHSYWIGGGNAVGRKPTIFHMLMCRFREMSGKLEFDSIEKDFKYSKDLMGLIKEKGKIDVEEFKNAKTDQVENIREILGQIDENETVAITDG